MLTASSAVASLQMAPDSATYQTDGTVKVIVRAGGVVYVGGDFSNVRPNGAAPGASQTPRHDLAAFDAANGQLLSWDPNANGEVRALAVSPDGSTIYAGGAFTTIGGATHQHLVALPTTTPGDTSTGKPLAFPAYTDGDVRALLAVGSRLYVGGNFHHINGAARRYLAAVSLSSGSLVSWAAQPDSWVNALEIAPSGKKVFVAGNFSHIGTQVEHDLVPVDPITGAVSAWGLRPGYAILGLATDATSLYVAGSGNGGHIVAYSLATGKIRWQDGADGDATDVSVYHDQLIVIGHFRHVDGLTAEHIADVASSDGTVDTSSWTPTLDQVLGGFAVLGYGEQVYAGGDFTKVNNHPLQSFAQFDDTNADTTPPTITTAPTASLAAGTVLGSTTAPVTVHWAGTDDMSGVCGYHLAQQIGSGAYTTVVPPFFTATSMTRSMKLGQGYRFEAGAWDCADNSGAMVAGDGNQINVFQNTNVGMHYTGSWSRNVRATGASGGTVTYTDRAGSAVSYSFKDTRQIAWVASKSPVRGEARIYLDGSSRAAATINLHSTTIQRRQIVYTHSWATRGAHTVRIVCVGTSGHPRIDVDALLSML